MKLCSFECKQTKRTEKNPSDHITFHVKYTHIHTWYTLIFYSTFDALTNLISSLTHSFGSLVQCSFTYKHTKRQVHIMCNNKKVRLLTLFSLSLFLLAGVFLICWLPFFTCNIMDAMCTKLDLACQPGVNAFIFTTWLGYMNSFVNPIIYTIFNPEFRKAFKKIMNI